jgi:hypothetical protein
MTFTTFRVRGDLPEDFKERFVKGIQREIFTPLDPDEEGDESIGWCSIEHPFDLQLDLDRVLFNSYLNLGLRIDKWRIPASLFKAHFVDAERRYLAEIQRDRLTKREKNELKVVVTTSLRRQILPSMKVVDLSWNLDAGILRFWSQTKRMLETLEEIFEETFEMSIVSNSPYTVAQQTGISQDVLATLDRLEPTPFHALFIEARDDEEGR